MSSGTKVIHRFLRQPNINSNIYNRISNRFDPFNNTLTVLKDPQSNRSLYLIGTTNSSTTLALRTKKLVEEIKPSTLYVQASKNWWNSARLVQVSIIIIVGWRSGHVQRNQQRLLLRLIFAPEQFERYSVETEILSLDGHNARRSGFPSWFQSFHSRTRSEIRSWWSWESQRQDPFRRSWIRSSYNWSPQDWDKNVRSHITVESSATF